MNCDRCGKDVAVTVVIKDVVSKEEERKDFNVCADCLEKDTKFLLNIMEGE